ncbi:MAG: CHAT domain-containing protein [Symploca sp. SIO2E9]|nr:CHAT domain-containing protein [Symploca sp. SIO2E9]
MADEPNAKAATKLSLGNTYRAQGNLIRDRLAEPKYEYIPWRCEEITRPDNNEALEDQHKKAEQKYKEAEQKYSQVIANDKSIPEKLRIKAKLNRLSLLLAQNNWQEADNLSSQININDLPENQSRVYARINYAKSLACLQQKYPQATHSWEEITKQIHTAIEESKELENKRDLEDRHTESYAIGNLGGLYEYLGQLSQKPKVPEFEKLCQKEQEFRKKAQCLTQEALYRAQPDKAPDIAYQWQWQLGRLLEAEGKTKEAITNYEAAIETLESVRSDLLAINSDVQFNFRDNVEPLYRELVALLLPVGENNPPQENLKKAIYYVDSLQLAELENFLRCNLQGNIETVKIQRISKYNERIEALFKGIDQILDNYPTKAAFLYSIVLKNQIAVILKLPGKEKLEYLQTRASKDSVIQTVDKALETMDCRNLNCNALNDQTAIIQGQKKLLHQLYQWLIGELENNLKKEKIKLLIFVSDNEFRRIPMSALFDGEHFVVEKGYATTISPGIQLLKYQASKTNQLKALIVGAIKKRPQLYDIKDEVKEQASSIIKKLENYQILSEGKFTKENLKREIQKTFYTMIHIIAHGQFSSDPKETYIFTDDESKETNDPNKYYLKINELGNLLQNRDQLRPIELLFLSSCQTSKGDKRAVLGIAGITIKSGTRGTIAPLWNAETISTRQLVKNFYENLVNQDEINKAEALRLAQNRLREEYDYSPYNWAGFVLVGN